MAYGYKTLTVVESGEIVNESRIGTLLGGKYQVTRLLGEGGMGSVYESENTWTGRRVAIKVLRREMITKRDVVARFMLEAKASTQINHPNIVEVIDMGEEPDGSLYIVQEFLDGSDLGKLLDQHPVLSPREALEVVVPIMGALVAAHRRGIIHRDLKPDNIFLVRSLGKVIPKLIDFGVSKVLDQDSDKRSTTQTGTAVGTPNYMSPEQARGDATVDGRCDVWAMGVVLYEMLTGRCPYDAPNYNLLIVKIIMEAPPRIEQFAPELPPELADIVHRALEPDRHKRYPSMRAFLSALLECHAIDTSGPALSELYQDSLGDMEVSGEIPMLDPSALDSILGSESPGLGGLSSRGSARPPALTSRAGNSRPPPPRSVPPRSVPPPPFGHSTPPATVDSEASTQEIVKIVLPADPKVLSAHHDDDARVTTPGHISPVTIEKQRSLRPSAPAPQPPRWLLVFVAVSLASLASVAGAWIAHTSTRPTRPRVTTTTAFYPPQGPSGHAPFTPPPAFSGQPPTAAPIAPTTLALPQLPDAGARTSARALPRRGLRAPAVPRRTSANGALILNP